MNTQKKLRSLFREDTAFPGYVFGSSWERYYFFPSDRMFDGSFVDFAKSLLSLENASTCCVINLSTIVSKESNEEAAVIIRPETSAEQYALDMEEGGPSSGWLYGIDTFAASSEKGEWCIYCERENDLGVLALDITDGDLQKKIIDMLQAVPGNQLYKNIVHQTFPLNVLTASWRDLLDKNYSRKYQII